MQYLRSFSRPRSLALLLIITLLTAVTGYAQQNVTLRGRLDPFAGDFRYGDVWGEGNYAYLASFNGTGVMIIDISNPAAPVMVGHYNPAAGSRFQDVIVLKGIGYFSSDNGGGVHIVDVRQPSQLVLMSQITAAEQGYASVHELALSDNLLYEADSRTTVVKVFNVDNPAAPVFLRNIQTTDTAFIHAVTVINGRLFTSGWNGRTDIFDVSRIRTEAPVLLGSVDSGVRSHSSWVSGDGRLLVSARETAGGDVRVFDISNPAMPVLRSTISAQTLGINALTPHNPYLVGHLLFVSWYQAGLQIIDLSNPSNPQRVGWYDTFEESGAITGFRGNWGVYPFLGLDRVLLSDMDNGLFVVDTTLATPLPRTVSAASYLPGAIATKSVAAAFGVGLTSMTAQAGTVPLPTTLALTSLRAIDSHGVERLAPLFFVSPNQINYQIPAGTAEGPVTIVVSGSDGQISRGVTIVSARAPAIFTLTQNGEGPAAALDGFTNEGAPFAATRSNGLPNIIAVYLTGLGEDATDVDNNIAASVEALIDGIPVSVDYAGRAPGFVGLNQLNLTLPAGISSGTHSLVVKRAGIASRTVTLQIK